MNNLFQQLEQWNDADEFTKCIEAIEAIPYAQRWAELNPSDEKAEMVIQECREVLSISGTTHNPWQSACLVWQAL